MSLHKELNTDLEITRPDQTLDETNFKAVIQDHQTTFSIDFNSIISDLFYSSFIAINQCSNFNFQCLNTYNFSVQSFLEFPLEEVRKFINPNVNFVTLDQCFYWYFRGEMVNDMFCNKCRQTINNRQNNFFYRCPRIFVIILNRGKNLQYNVKIQFDEKLNLQKNYFCGLLGNSPDFTYELIGVVTHMGSSSSISGHYVAFCRSPITRKWEFFNDDKVSDVDFRSNIANYATPYILFYHKC